MRSSITKRIALLALLLLSAVPATSWAVSPDEMLRDPKLEARARLLSEGLRCVVCQNQSIDDSNAPIARDLRILLRERISAGDSDDDAVAYIVARYGNFVLLKPPVQWNTLALWIGPAIFLLASIVGAAFYIRSGANSRGGESVVPDLSSEEQRRLEALLGKKVAP